MFVFFPPSLKKDLNSYLIKKHARRAACVFTLAWVDSSPKIFLPEHRPRNFASSCESGDEVANKWNCFTIALSVSVKPEWCEQIYHTEHAHFNQKKISTKPEGVMSPSSHKIWNEWKIFHQSELKGRFMQLFSKLSIEWGIYPGLSSKVCCQLLWNILRWNLGCMVVKNNSSHVNMYCWAISQEVRSRQKKRLPAQVEKQKCWIIHVLLSCQDPLLGNWPVATAHKATTISILRIYPLWQTLKLRLAQVTLSCAFRNTVRPIAE